MNIDPMEILLVEDSDEDAELTMRAFKKLRLANRVVRAKDGAEALQMLTAPIENGRNAGEGLKLVLLDLKLPKVDGLEVLREIKNDPKMRSIPIVVLTSSKEDRDLQRAYELGVNSYIVKPVDFEKFIDSVEQLGFYWMVLNQRPTP
jgi:two-component system, response regulator